MRAALRLVVASALVLVVTASMAVAEDPATSVTLNAPTVGATTIGVTGKATFVGAAEVVGTRAAGGAGLPGTDMRSASITPISNTVVQFDLQVADLAPQIGGTPEMVNYWWEFDVVVNGAVKATNALQAWRTSVAADLTCGVVFACPPGEPGEPRFQLSTCATDPNTGQRTCSAEPLAGSFSSDTISFTVPLSMIQATGGGELVPVGSIAASYGASGITWNSAGAAGRTMSWNGWNFKRSVTLGIAPAGTPDDQVETTIPVTSLSASGSSSSNGTFAGSVPLPAEPGTYKIVARACLGVGNCGTASQLITIP